MKKPYSSFPLSPHSSGQWRKKINGEVYYFGDDWRKALKEYEKIVKGDAPRGNTVSTLVEKFLDTKKLAVDSGEIKPDTLKEYERAAEKLKESVGENTLLKTLDPSHFIHLRGEIANGFAPATVKRYVILVRAILSFAYDSGLVPQPLRYKQAMKTPSARLIRKAKHEGVKKLFTADEVRQLLDSATGYMKPAILLGINCGFGNLDVCDLMWDQVDQEWVSLVRTKTYVERRAYLWPETREALSEWRSNSPVSQYVCCGERGQHLGGETNSTPIAHRFRDLADKCGIAGRGFYALRHTYRTVADECQDTPAIMMTMGHADQTINSQYRQGISEERLHAVAMTVRNWMGY